MVRLGLEKEVADQYGIISKMSFSEILELLINGCDNPIHIRTLEQGDTIVYSEGFSLSSVWATVDSVRIARQFKGTNGSFPLLSKQVSFFTVSYLNDKNKHGGLRDEMKYWMYHIKFVGDRLFKELYTDEAEFDYHEEANYSRRMMLDKIDRPTIVFNIQTGDKWICDWNHPKVYNNRTLSPRLKFHSGSASVFEHSKIVILNQFEYKNFINWNSNPFEVK